MPVKAILDRQPAEAEHTRSEPYKLKQSRSKYEMAGLAFQLFSVRDLHRFSFTIMQIRQINLPVSQRH